MKYWQVRYDKAVPKQIAKSGYHDQIFSKIEELLDAENPLCVPGVKAVGIDFPGCHRQRAGKYRIVFQLNCDQVEVELSKGQKGVIYIHKVAHRKDVYN